MQLGREALEKSNSSSSQQSSQQKSSITESVLTDPDIKLPFVLTHKRGSFLTRSETTLARLAELTRTSSGALASGPKNSRNFVFTTVEKTDTTLVIEESSVSNFLLLFFSLHFATKIISSGEETKGRTGHP